MRLSFNFKDYTMRSTIQICVPYIWYLCALS